MKNFILALVFIGVVCVYSFQSEEFKNHVPVKNEEKSIGKLSHIEITVPIVQEDLGHEEDDEEDLEETYSDSEQLPILTGEEPMSAKIDKNDFERKSLDRPFLSRKPAITY
jgi:hypothetical protein